MDLQGPLTSTSIVFYPDESGQEPHFNEQSSKILGVLANRASQSRNLAFTISTTALRLNQLNTFQICPPDTVAYPWLGRLLLGTR
jgi:hypothetical protein